MLQTGLCMLDWEHIGALRSTATRLIHHAPIRPVILLTRMPIVIYNISWMVPQVDEMDYDRRIDAYAKLNSAFWSSASPLQAQLLLYRSAGSAL